MHILYTFMCKWQRHLQIDKTCIAVVAVLVVVVMMESPVGTTYELRSHSLLPVGP